MLRLFIMCLIPVSLSETSYFETRSSAILSIETSANLKDLPSQHEENHLLTMSIFSGRFGVLLLSDKDNFASGFKFMGFCVAVVIFVMLFLLKIFLEL